MKLLLVFAFLVQAHASFECTQISAGLYESCIIDSFGDVYCWGSNSAGGVGDGSTTEMHSTPNKVDLGGVEAISIDSGYAHSCAVLADNTMKCWGLGSLGQLGNNATQENNPTPQTVIGIDSAIKVSIAPTGMFTCALLSSGEVNCWGEGIFGQLGNGQSTNNPVPQPVINVTSAVDLFTSPSSACALLSTGSFMCWGLNGNNVFSTTNNNDDFLTPVVSDIFHNSTIKVAIGDNNVCELRGDKTVWCKGDNSWGPFGLNSISAQVHEFEQALLISNAIDFSFNGKTLCVAMENGEIACSGQGEYGNLGQGDFNNSEFMVIAATDSTSVVVGRSHTCVNSVTGPLCFGINDEGQCGVGNIEPQPSPSKVVALTGVCKTQTISALASSYAGIIIGLSVGVLVLSVIAISLRLFKTRYERI